VTARVENGGLRIQEGRCPNLLREAQLYRYDDCPEGRAESPLNETNHALDALRYLIISLDARRLAGRRSQPSEETAAPEAALPKPKPRPWLRLDNEELWTDVGSIRRNPGYLEEP